MRETLFAAVRAAPDDDDARRVVRWIERFGCHIFGGSYFGRTGWSSGAVHVDL